MHGEQGCAGCDAKRIKILPDQIPSGCMLFDEDDFRCSAAERFDADGSGARINIDESGAFDGRSNDVEKSFAQAVAGRTEFQPAETFQDAAAIFSRDDAHGQPTRAR